MLNGGNTWSDNQYFMSDGGGRFQWGGSKTFPQFKDAAHETGSISQSYPDTSGWLTASPATPATTTARPVPTPSARPEISSRSSATTATTSFISWAIRIAFPAATATTRCTPVARAIPSTATPATTRSPSPGVNQLFGGAGNDVYFVDNAGDGIENANEGNDTVYSTASSDWRRTWKSWCCRAPRPAGLRQWLENTLYGKPEATSSTAMPGPTPCRRRRHRYLFRGQCRRPGDREIQRGQRHGLFDRPLRLSANVETLVLQGSADLQGYGNSLSNTIYGNTGNNILDGDAGADTMPAGPATIPTSSTMPATLAIENAGEGNDTVFSTAHLGLSANVETLVLQGSADLQGDGNSLANTLYGNTGNNLLNGGAGADTMIGGAGNDITSSTTRRVVVENANEGTDAVFSASTTTGSERGDAGAAGVRALAGHRQCLANTSTAMPATTCSTAGRALMCSRAMAAKRHLRVRRRARQRRHRRRLRRQRHERREICSTSSATAPARPSAPSMPPIGRSISTVAVRRDHHLHEWRDDRSERGPVLLNCDITVSSCCRCVASGRPEGMISTVPLRSCAIESGTADVLFSAHLEMALRLRVLHRRLSTGSMLLLHRKLKHPVPARLSHHSSITLCQSATRVSRSASA